MARRTGNRLGVALAGTGLLALGITVPAVAREAPPTYYVDAQAGDDSADGTSPETAWKTVEKASQAKLEPGSSLLLKRGQSWSGQLAVDDAGTEDARITVGAYGKGDAPLVQGDSDACVAVSGEYVVVRDLQVGVPRDEGRCSWSGISVRGKHNTVTKNYVTGAAAGVFIAPDADGTFVTENQLVDNNFMSVNTPGGDDDSGAFAMLVQGNNSDIGWNHIEGSIAESHDYGLDGAAIEIFNGSGNRFHHNVSVDNETFTELGRSGDDPDGVTKDNEFLYNAVYGKKTRAGVVTRGPDDGNGPVLGTVVANNSINLTNPESEGVVCYAGCTNEHLELAQNVVRAESKVGSIDAGFTATTANVFWGGKIEFDLGEGDVEADPKYVSDTDLHTRDGSPAIDLGTKPRAEQDLDRQPVGAGQGVDAGAYEHVG